MLTKLSIFTLMVLVTALYGCGSSSTDVLAAKEGMAKLKSVSVDKIQDVFVIEVGTGNMVCGRYSDELFAYTPQSGIVSKSRSADYFETFWRLCSSKNSELASVAENRANSVLQASSIKAGDAVASSKKIVLKEQSAWSSSVDKSAIDDSELVNLWVDANESIEGNISIELVKPRLVVRCMENKTSLIVLWNRYLGLNSTEVTIRVDSEKAQTSSWLISTANDAVFSQKPISLAKSLFGKKKLLVKITPYGSNPITVTFNLAGLEQEIKPLRSACSW